MHILAGESALAALRAVRYRELVAPFDYPAPVRCRAHLPGQEAEEDDDADVAAFAARAFAEKLRVMPTLEATDFDFAAVESNARPDVWALGDIGSFTEERPLELGVFDRGKRVWRKKSHVRLLSRSLPENALVRLSPNLYTACPELVVLHMAAYKSSLQLTKLIMELCGSYTLYPNPDVHEKAKLNVEPVTSIDRIRSYLGRVGVRGGLDRLRLALNMAMEGSASPGETRMALMMSMPLEQGGYGFARPHLNAEVVTPEWERAHVGGETYYLDAFWQDAYADLEYESTEFHLDPLVAESLVAVRQGDEHADPTVSAQRTSYIKKAEADRRRLRELQYLGVHVIPVTSFDLGDVGRMDQVARALARSYFRTAKWYEAYLEDKPAAEDDRGNRKTSRRKHEELGGASRHQTMSASYWEDWPDCFDAHAYREARTALLGALSEDETLAS